MSGLESWMIFRVELRMKKMSFLSFFIKNQIANVQANKYIPLSPLGKAKKCPKNAVEYFEKKFLTG